MNTPDNLNWRQRVYESYRSGQNADVQNISFDGQEPYLRKLIADHFPQDRQTRILDLGCGAGALLFFLSKQGYKNLKGVDVSVEQVNAAQLKGLTFIVKDDLFKFLASTESESLDVVVMLDVIEHLTKPELMVISDEVHRVLSLSGKWIIHCPNAASPFFGSVRYGDWTHEQAFTAESLRQIAKAASFKKIDSYEDRPIPHGLKSILRLSLWYFIRTFWQVFSFVETGASEHILSRNFLSVIGK